MSLTKRTWTDLIGAHTLTFTGSVSSATTKLTIVFQASSAIYGVKSSINVYVNGTKQSCTWTTNKTESLVGTTYKTKMTSSQMTISKPFFTLKLTDSSDGDVIYEATFSFYEIEKAPTAATCSGGVMDGTTKSKVTFTTRQPLRWAPTLDRRPRPRRSSPMRSRSAGATLSQTPRPARQMLYVRCSTAVRSIPRSPRQSRFPYLQAWFRQCHRSPLQIKRVHPCRLHGTCLYSTRVASGCQPSRPQEPIAPRSRPSSCRSEPSPPQRITQPQLCRRSTRSPRADR